MSIALLTLESCSIQQTINITIMSNKKPQFKTRYTWTVKDIQYHVNDGKSLTVQGEAYSVQELMKRHVQGIMPPVGLTPLYDHDEPTHDDDVTLRKPDLDLSDIDKIKNKVKKSQDTIKKYNKSKNQKAETATPDRTSKGNDEAE